MDLSYNEESLYKFRFMIDEEVDKNIKSALAVLMNDRVLFDHCDDIDFMEARIKEELKNHTILQRVLMVSIAKQFLKGICDCISTKADEDSEDAKERAYKSFHMLDYYIKLKSDTGIVYSCTRLPEMVGKNVVLYNIKDDETIKGFVKRYHNEVDCS